ncbi:hypothetical protein [Amycolatopsis sp. PS_44_ISF1]|uniref:hypothetical protein n=1 Tax=Amycolatopsis sp. PS_44_ISF1 TaxID=2974917 RepID=UPI0028DF9F31|nr:hypothetical protein [Amycolatopsis sp. PS_44_ISF1]MDT8913138.1 hypothetical protein [Amycolatopsis sp. PS_44_ISF1]
MTAPAGDHGVIARNLRAFLRANRDVLRRLGQCLAEAPEPEPDPEDFRVHVDMKGIATTDDEVTSLYTDGFGGCIAVVLLGPGRTRTLAHIYSGHFPSTLAASAPAWDRLGELRALAAAADAAHVYHQPGYWEAGDGGSCDEFLVYFGLDPARTALHGAPATVEVGPQGEVTP